MEEPEQKAQVVTADRFRGSHGTHVSPIWAEYIGVWHVRRPGRASRGEQRTSSGRPPTGSSLRELNACIATSRRASPATETRNAAVDQSPTTPLSHEIPDRGAREPGAASCLRLAQTAVEADDLEDPAYAGRPQGVPRDRSSI